MGHFKRKTKIRRSFICVKVGKLLLRNQKNNFRFSVLQLHFFNEKVGFCSFCILFWGMHFPNNYAACDKCDCDSLSRLIQAADREKQKPKGNYERMFDPHYLLAHFDLHWMGSGTSYEVGRWLVDAFVFGIVLHHQYFWCFVLKLKIFKTELLQFEKLNKSQET